MKVDGREITMRYDVFPDDMTAVAFVPKDLTGGEVGREHIKRAQVGAAFVGHFERLPHNHAGIVWELAASTVPPAKFKPVKPKMWLKDHLELKANFYYQLD